MSLISYQTYKPTNLQWIERVPCHWELKALKHCITRLGSGGTPESGNPDYWTDEDDEEGVPWVSIGDMTTSTIVKSTQKRITRSGLASKGLEIFPVGSLLYSIYASLGKVATLGIGATFNQAILAIMPDETTVSQSYLCYWLQSLEAHLAYYASSNTQANLNAAKVLSYPVALPSQEEQLAIATFLDRETAKIDALIAEQQRLIELLQEKRQSVISHAVTKGLNPSAPMKDSGVEWLGEVPDHWEVGQLRRFAKAVKTGRTPDESDFIEQESGIPWFTPGSFNELTLALQAAKHVSIESLNKGRANLFPGNAVLVVGIGATLGKVGVPSEDCSGNQQINAIEPSGKLEQGFLALFLSAAQEQMRISSNSSTLGIMNQQKTKELVVSCPPLAEQREIIDYADKVIADIIDMSRQAERVIKLLQERRSALISAAVTGQIDVRGLATEEDP